MPDPSDLARALEEAQGSAAADAVALLPQCHLLGEFL